MGTKIYIFIMVATLAAIVAVFNALPRSTFSEIEKRELTTLPTFSWKALADGSLTSNISAWYSDTEPYRDELITISMEVKNMQRITLSNEQAISFTAGEMAVSDTIVEKEVVKDTIADYNNILNTDEDAKIANAGILVIGTGDSVRALMAFGGSKGSGKAFATMVNTYHETLPGVRVYAMVIPIAIEFYCPTRAKRYTAPQRPFITATYEAMSEGVTTVDVYSTLAAHANEDIYLRTDHHWAPLGAYYGAQAFAAAAGVPFPTLEAYQQKTIHRFVGSMYGYSGDIAVKKAPEDFVYYVPTGVSYETTYIDYRKSADGGIAGEKKPFKGLFFWRVKDGSGLAYTTFMGTDKRLTQVRTTAGTGRRLLIIKDSFGNALPGYMFYSFDEVHVADFRYFVRNMVEYIEQNGITDVLIAVNVFNATSSKIAHRITHLLTQKTLQHSTINAQPLSRGEALPSPAIVDTLTDTLTTPLDTIQHDTIPHDTIHTILPLTTGQDTDSIN